MENKGNTYMIAQQPVMWDREQYYITSKDKFIYLLYSDESMKDP